MVSGTINSLELVSLLLNLDISTHFILSQKCIHPTTTCKHARYILSNWMSICTNSTLSLNPSWLYKQTWYWSVSNETPEYLCNVICKALESGVNHRYPTRSAGSRVVAEAKLKTANTSFRWRASKQYAELPMDLKTEQNTKAFLNRLRKHTIDNIDIWAGQQLYEWRMSDSIWVNWMYDQLLCILMYCKSSSWNKSEAICVKQLVMYLNTWGNKLNYYRS